jgi:hypothetical protein
MNKSHPLAVAPGGFKTSPCLQEQMCRPGTKMTFEESEEEPNRLPGIRSNARQIERLCHHCGEQLEQIDWREVHKDGVQLQIPFNKNLYLLMDGSMLSYTRRSQLSQILRQLKKDSKSQAKSLFGTWGGGGLGGELGMS